MAISFYAIYEISKFIERDETSCGYVVPALTQNNIITKAVFDSIKKESAYTELENNIYEKSLQISKLLAYSIISRYLDKKGTWEMLQLTFSLTPEGRYDLILINAHFSLTAKKISMYIRVASKL